MIYDEFQDVVSKLAPRLLATFHETVDLITFPTFFCSFFGGKRAGYFDGWMREKANKKVKLKLIEALGSWSSERWYRTGILCVEPSEGFRMGVLPPVLRIPTET